MQGQNHIKSFISCIVCTAFPSRLTINLISTVLPDEQRIARVSLTSLNFVAVIPDIVIMLLHT